MKPRQGAGFTLLEGLFSMLMVLLVLGGLASTLSNSAKVRANRQNMDRAVEELYVLNSVRAELMASLSVLEPSAGVESSELRLRKVDSRRSFLDRIDIINGPESPFDSSEQIEVRFRVADDLLLREVVPADGVVQGIAVTRISRMLVRRDQQMMTLSLTFPYSRVEKSRTMKVELR